MELDFSPLQKAIEQLEKSLKYANSPQAEADPGLFEQLRNSVIQCFEFTYELSHKMLRRYLKERTASPDDIELSTFADLIRTGNEQKLLRSDWSRWKAYRQARTDSSHAYDEDKAIAVYRIAPEFLEETKYLYRELMK
ncbi:MAG: HI0074 family nucleotidyltransferase substrate-binding subunit [Thiomicrorhabdus sp.]|jgi:nucleotidyltransferase substrate binding protein (TIGR01987 family)|nr:HI0074 family nucleotidyltransferase substrate-binding subunit [Thiomicrorhabdus sp.]